MPTKNNNLRSKTYRGIKDNNNCSSMKVINPVQRLSVHIILTF